MEISKKNVIILALPKEMNKFLKVLFRIFGNDLIRFKNMLKIRIENVTESFCFLV